MPSKIQQDDPSKNVYRPQWKHRILPPIFGMRGKRPLEDHRSLSMRTLSFKRPLMAAGIPFLIGAFLGAQTWLPWLSLLFLAAVSIFFLFFRHQKQAVFFSAFLLCGILCTGIYQATRPILPVQSGQTVAVRGIVSDTRTYRSGSRFLLEQADINGADTNVTVQISLYYENEIADGDTVELRAVCRTDSHAFFDADRYYYERGIDLNATGDTILVHEKAESRSLSSWFSESRNALSDTILSLFSRENAVFLQGMLLGIDDELSLESADILNRSGARHLFVVSGLHLTLAVGLLYSFCRRLRLPIRLCSGIAILASFGIVLLTGCTVPSLRAAFMTCVVYAGRLFFRRADSANSLFGAAIFIVLLAPYSITSASFLLSFSASAGVYILPPLFLDMLAERFPQFNRSSSLINTLAATLTGSAAVFPASVWMLGGVSLLSPLTNLLVSFLLTPLFISGILGLCGIPLLSELATLCCETLLTLLRSILTFLAETPFSYMGTQELYFTVWSVLAVLWLFFVLFRHRNWKTLLRHFLALLLLLPFAMGVAQIATRPYLIATAASTSSAELVLLERDGNADLIVKETRAGWGANALSLLRGRNVRTLRSLILLTEDSLSVSAPVFLAEEYCPETILLYSENTLSTYTDTLFPEETKTVFLSETGRRILYPGLDIRRSGDRITLNISNGERELILSNTVPTDADCWLLFSEEWEELHLNSRQNAVLLSVPDDLEIYGGKLYNAQSDVVTVYLPADGDPYIQK